MIDVMKATNNTIIGYGMFNFVPPHTGGDGPGFDTRRHNPREATTGSIKDLYDQIQTQTGGLIRDQAKWAMIMGVKREWIKNLEEITNFQVDSTEKIPVIEWTESARNGVADLFNGNHRYQILLEILREVTEQREDVVTRMKKFEETGNPSKAQKTQHEKDKSILKDLEESLEVEALFAVQLVDLGE